MTILEGDFTLVTGSTSRVLQLTDTHLMQEPGSELLGVDTDASLAAVCRLAKIRPTYDLILLTGDLAGDESAGSYRRLEELIGPLGVPSFWLPGNHDSVWHESHPLFERFKRRIHLPHWDILMLNTQVPAYTGGHLSVFELEALSESVDYSRRTSRPLLVATHHPLLEVGCAWLDSQCVDNGLEAIKLLEQALAPVLVISGHVHQISMKNVNGINLMTSPSTCIQFARHSDFFQLDNSPPGFRELQLHQAGDFETHIERVTDEVFCAELDSRGYA